MDHEPPRYCTIEKYFQIDREGEPVKYEFFASKSNPRRGEIIAMAGSSSNHALITLNVGAELRQRLRGTACRVFSPDKRIATLSNPTYTYPDVSVICGPEQTDPRDPRGVTAINPTLIVEVLSDSTEFNDRSRKFRRYLEAESLQEYVLVAQDLPSVESYFRQPDGTWLFSYAFDIASSLRLRSVNAELPLVEIYLNVEFPPPKPEPAESR
jgi:Uma2 family endonuclease